MADITDPNITLRLTEEIQKVAPVNGVAISDRQRTDSDVLNTTVDPARWVSIDYQASADDGQRAAGDLVARDFNLAEPARRPRVLYDIHQDVRALTGAQKTNIAADLFGGSPPRVATDTGPNAPDLLVLWTLRQLGTLSAADRRLCEEDAMSIYNLDNPSYLVHPAFDPTINVPGDEPVVPPADDLVERRRDQARRDERGRE